MTHGLFFIRPATGDVIAHFAKIDGEFIVVSSLNHEVYKGKNVRQIVDRMLASHPAVIPQNQNGEPPVTASNSGDLAFLAAAYILTIDGVVKKTLEEVIFEGIIECCEERRLVVIKFHFKVRAIEKYFFRHQRFKITMFQKVPPSYQHDMLIQDPDHAGTVEVHEKEGLCKWRWTPKHKTRMPVYHRYLHEIPLMVQL